MSGSNGLNGSVASAPGKDVLERIIASTRAEVVRRREGTSIETLRQGIAAQDDAPRGFGSALKERTAQGRFALITEVKKASPSGGLIREEFDPAAIARAYEAGGATCLSVLTEGPHFQGSERDLIAARGASSLPVLRKDFIVDPWQVWEARAAGADSFLLIVAVLSDELLAELLALGRELGMEPLVEVHSREELARANAASAKIIGVNNRDLRDFKVSLQTSFDLVQAIPENAVAVSESGLHNREDIERLRSAGFDAFLIGERVMKQADPGVGLKELLRAVDAGAAGTH